MNGYKRLGKWALVGLLTISPFQSQAGLKRSVDLYLNGGAIAGESVDQFNPGGGFGIGVGVLEDKTGIGARVNVEYAKSAGDIFLNFKERFGRDDIGGRIDSVNVISADIAGRVGKGVYLMGGISFAHVRNSVLAGNIERGEGSGQRTSSGRNAVGWNLGLGGEYFPNNWEDDNGSGVGLYVEGSYRDVKFLGEDGRFQNFGGRFGLRFRF